MPLKILYVEDHEDTATLYAKLMRAMGHEVTVARTLAEGRTAGQSKRFDLLLCDIGLPDGVGGDLMKELSACYPIRGIALTGYGMPHEIANAKAAGFEGHLLKPIDLARLKSLIESLDGGE